MRTWDISIWLCILSPLWPEDSCLGREVGTGHFSHVSATSGDALWPPGAAGKEQDVSKPCLLATSVCSWWANTLDWDPCLLSIPLGSFPVQTNYCPSSEINHLLLEPFCLLLNAGIGNRQSGVHKQSFFDRLVLVREKQKSDGEQQQNSVTKFNIGQDYSSSDWF